MDGAATDAVRGLKAEKDTDLALIWEALSGRFGHVDEPERAMRRFDVRRQQDGETLTLFEQNLRILHRELVAWHSGRTSVSGRRTFPVLRSTCS